MERFLRLFKHLPGKLMISYMLASVLTFLTIELLLLGTFLVQVNLGISESVLGSIQKDAPLASTYFVHARPDREAADSWLQLVFKDLQDQSASPNSILALSIVTPVGETVASVGPELKAVGETIQAKISAKNRARLQAVLADKAGKTSIVADDRPGTIVAIAPIISAKGQVEGALVLKAERPTVATLGNVFLLFLLTSGIFITLLTALVGIVFGYLTARGLTGRLRRLSEISNQWSAGDFSVQANDTSADEIGQMARQFNQMARQLQTLLQAQQELATLEERNRLARDLHDSIKQQLFAAIMQLRATKVLLRRDVDAAEVRLQTSDKLLRQAQQELTTLIRELRPAALEGQALVPALRELSAQWAEQNSLMVTIQAPESDRLPRALEEALYRIMQEALANIARHSHATLVQITFSRTEQSVTLAIVDDGQGFEVEQVRVGVGLRSMQERMQVFGGDVQIKSAPGQGTQVIAQCPILGIDSAEVNSQQQYTSSTATQSSAST